jgi:ribosomal protein S18 acetylase RimI-like enzyme
MPGTSSTTETRDIAGRRASSEILVAEVGGRIVGCVTFVDGRKQLGEVDDPDAATVRMLGVATEARGRGVGEALMQECIDRAPSIRTEACSSGYSNVDDERAAPLRAAWFPA